MAGPPQPQGKMACVINPYTGVNALICLSLYVYICWGMSVMRYPAYQPVNCCEWTNLFIRQAVLLVALFSSAPYVFNGLIYIAYENINYECIGVITDAQ